MAAPRKGCGRVPLAFDHAAEGVVRAQAKAQAYEAALARWADSASALRR